MSRTNRHIVLDMADGYESDGEIGGAPRRGRLEDRWVHISPGGNVSEDLADRLNALMYSFSPLFAHVDTVNARLGAIAAASRRGERIERSSSPPIVTNLTQSLDNLPVMVNDPMSNVRRHNPPTRRANNNNRTRRPPSPDVEQGQSNEAQGDSVPLMPPSEEHDRQEGQAEEEEENDEQLHVNSSDLLALVPKLFKYAPAILILFTKFVIDHFLGIISSCALILTYFHTNNVVKCEAMKPSDRSTRKLLLAILHIACCLLFVDFVEDYGSRYGNLLIMMPNYQRPSGLWDLLWIVFLTDTFLTLITISLKIFLTILPLKILPFKKRGKIYCFVETSSQLYRAIVPLQPWIFFLLESYEGYEKIISVGLTSAYIVSKGFEITRRAIILRKSFDQLLKSTNIGVLPNKAQIEAAGKLCPICHEEYTTPVLLNCSHIFCEMCVSVWLNKVQTCPLCRAQVVTSSTWRNGATSAYFQMY